MGAWLELIAFTPLQWGLIVFSFVTCAVVSERALARAKRDSISQMLEAQRDAGLCNRCLMREKKRLEKMGFAAVETERLMRQKSGFTRV